MRQSNVAAHLLAVYCSTSKLRSSEANNNLTTAASLLVVCQLQIIERERVKMQVVWTCTGDRPGGIDTIVHSSLSFEPF